MGGWFDEEDREGRDVVGGRKGGSELDSNVSFVRPCRPILLDPSTQKRFVSRFSSSVVTAAKTPTAHLRNSTELVLCRPSNAFPRLLVAFELQSSY